MAPVAALMALPLAAEPDAPQICELSRKRTALNQRDYANLEDKGLSGESVVCVSQW